MLLPYYGETSNLYKMGKHRGSDSGSQASDDSEESLDLGESSSDSEGDASVGSIPSVKQVPNKRVASPEAEVTVAKKGKTESSSSSVNVKSPAPIKQTKATSSSSKPATTSSSAGLLASGMANPTASSSSAITSNIEGGDITRGPPVTTDIAAKKLIAQYLRQQNRPYSAIQVHDNLHKRIPKATVERVLASMSLPDGGFICKEYGKAKIFFVDQSTLPSEFTTAQLDQLTQENEALKREADAAHQEERRVKSELQQLLSEPTDEELRVQVQEAREGVAQKQEKVARLSSSTTCGTGAGGASSSSARGGGSGDISSNSGSHKFSTLADAVLAHNQFRRAWQQRKGLCMEAVDMLSEGMGKKVKDVLAEMCLETDQDAGVTLPAFLPELP